MTRTVLRGGRVFDGTKGPIADGDVVIEDGLFADVCVGLNGNEQIDVSGQRSCPVFDRRVDVTMSGVNLMRALLRVP
jgi:N-acyl-D-aspartate/D-glutamate deacylase